jgi:hypothetical protein
MTSGWMQNDQKGIEQKGANFKKAVSDAFNNGDSLGANVALIASKYKVTVQQVIDSTSSMANEMIAGGKDADEVYQQLAKSTGMSVPVIKKAAEEQKKMNEQALYEKAIRAATGADYDKAVNAIEEQIKADQGIVDNLMRKQALGQTLTKEERNQYNEKQKSLAILQGQLGKLTEANALIELRQRYLRGEKLTHEEIQRVMVAYKSEYQKIVEGTGNVFTKWQQVFNLINSGGKSQTEESEKQEKIANKTAATKESDYQKALKQVDLSEKRLALDKDINDEIAKGAINKEKREKTTKDEIADAERSLKLEKDKLDTFLKAMNLQTETSPITITTVVEEQNEIKFRIDQLNNNIRKEQNNVDAINIKVSISESKEAMELADKAIKKRGEAYKKMAETRKKAEENAFSSVESLHKKELDDIQLIIDTYMRMFDVIAANGEDIATAKANAEKEKELELLDKKYGKLKDISDEEKKYNDEKAKIEQAAQTQISMIQEVARGVRIEAERQMTIIILEEQQKRLQAELALLDKNKDKEKYENTTKALDDLTNQIGTKKDLLLAYSSEIQIGLTTAFSNLFADEEQMKAPWKKLFAVMSGALKKYLSLLVAELVFGDLKKLGVGSIEAVVLVPALMGLANAVLGQILDPILASVASFATSGVVDRPTLAWIGDARKAGSRSDAEAVLNSEVFASVIDYVLGSYTSILDKYFSTSLSYDSSGEVNDLSKVVSRLSTAINQIEPYFKSGMFTPENILALIDQYTERKMLDLKYDSNELSIEDYASKLNNVQVNVSRYTQSQPALYSPGLALMSQNATNSPVAVMNDPRLREVITESADMAANKINEKLDEVISEITGALNAFDGRLRIVESDIGEAAGRFQNRQTMNTRRDWYKM